MYLSKSNFLAQNEIVDFTLPKLHRGKYWYVDFCAYDPVSDRLKRKKYMLDRYKTKKQKEAMASILIHNIYHRLIAGWNPFVNSNKTRQYTDTSKVFQHYIDFTIVAERKNILKPKTAVDYRSRMNQLKLYIEEAGVKPKHINQFNKNFVVDFLDYLILDKDVSAKTRNNYRTWLSTLGTWLLDRHFIDENPAKDIHSMREEEKFRDPISPADLTILRNYTKDVCPPFYLACMMEYYTFIRPDELRYIHIGDISVSEQTVYVSSSISKNRKGQAVAINDTLLKIMIQQHVFDHPSQDYLFGNNIYPGPVQIYVNRFRIEWNKVRSGLNFPASYQFYSLKDSGIRDLANAEGIVIARDQARHSDVAITNKYLKNANFAHEEAKHFKGEL